MFRKKGVLKDFANFAGKHLPLFNKVQALKFGKIFRTPTLKSICKRLLLYSYGSFQKIWGKPENVKSKGNEK